MKITHRWLAGLLASLALGAVLLPADPEPSAVSDQQWKEGKVKIKPKPLKQPAPEYPEKMSRLGLVGKVSLDFIIDTEGNVRNPVVIRSNNPWFERPAIIALLKWKFTPAEIDGRKISTRVRQEIVFDLWHGGQSPWTLSNARAPKALPPEFQWDVAPKPTNTAFPVYPFEALRAGKKGKTQVVYIIDEHGRVIESRVVEATTPEMGQAVLAMINTWQFEPARKKGGQPTPTALGMTHEFDPEGSGDVPISDEAQWILDDLKRHPEKIVELKDLDEPLKPLSRRPPAYPLAQRGGKGSATIEFFVDKNGDAQLPHVLSSTAPEFGYAAAQAVATWRFEVAKKGGKPVVARAAIPIDFNPKSADQPKKPAQ